MKREKLFRRTVVGIALAALLGLMFSPAAPASKQKKRTPFYVIHDVVDAQTRRLAIAAVWSRTAPCRKSSSSRALACSKAVVHWPNSSNFVMTRTFPSTSRSESLNPTVASQSTIVAAPFWYATMKSPAERATGQSRLARLASPSSSLPLAESLNASAIVISDPLPDSLARLKVWSDLVEYLPIARKRAHQARALLLIASDPPCNSPLGILSANSSACSVTLNPTKKRARRITVSFF